ncbi:MAG TPA: histidinol-phosphatase HisJ family protein [Candidatus Ozemobacteraceae bacterium]|nr:histidinol-phosphatase HisJ family protein [Candidatus Ozemobacteraceae bacterium]HQG27517.1 histidinol-phosphatase HisJ family protein [Candidatus Ozemobacteraceae bacterium]
MIDQHNHTRFSSDGTAHPETMLEAAGAVGIRYLAITDHADFAPSDPCIDPAAYLPALERYRDNPWGIRLGIGVELGIQVCHAPQVAAFLRGRNFDFVIASMHRACGLDIADGSFHRGRSVETAWSDFLDDTLASMNACPDFDTLGHFDILSRYDATRGTAPSEAHAEKLDAVLAWLIAHGKCLELNTSARRYEVGHMHPSEKILKRYVELGGTRVTIGSDAHRPNSVGTGVFEMLRLLRDSGIETLPFFLQRRATMIPIGKLMDEAGRDGRRREGADS